MTNGSKRGKVAIWAVLLFSLAGVGISLELTRIHYLTHTDPDYHSICAVNDQVNCETVAQSPFSVFIGVPISVWGVLGYLFLTAFCAWGFIDRRLHGGWPLGLMWVFSAVFVLCSALLAYISFRRIDSMCLFCMALYVVNLAMLVVTTAVSLKTKPIPFFLLRSDLKALFSMPYRSAGLAGVFAIVAVCLFIWFPHYWSHPGWSDIPSLPNGTDDGNKHWIGAEHPAVTVEEFSDYQCPFCRRAHKNARLIIAKHSESVRLVHRQLPLDSKCNLGIKRDLHQRACEFAEAAECAAEQGKFWEMNDALFSIQDQMRPDEVDIDQIAVQIGLDRSELKQCMADDRTLGRIKADIRESQTRDVSGTPTFFINSQPYPGSLPEDVLERAVKKALPAKGL